MQKVTQPFNLTCFNEIKEFTKEFMQQYDQEQIYATMVPLPQALIDAFNDEMYAVGLGKARHFMAIKRKNYSTKDKKYCHIDLVHMTIILPIENCENSVMFFYDGDYELESRQHGKNYGLNYGHIIWNSDDAEYYEECITVPTLTSANVPHSATSSDDGSYRLVLTIRLEGDPSFEEVCARFSA